MLQTLKNCNSREVEAILAKLSASILPNPGIEPSVQEQLLDPKLQTELMNEIRLRLGLRRDDDSSKAKARLYRFLAEELTKAALADVDVLEVKTRLGQRGGLSPDLYKIKFSPYFHDGPEKLGVRKDQVEETLRD